jgi:Metal-dependent proteases with possible chaperone activity
VEGPGVPLILGIETSCDETAAALVTEDGHIRSNVIASQAELHARYGGVVPEVASRRHLELVSPVIARRSRRRTRASRTSTASP